MEKSPFKVRKNLHSKLIFARFYKLITSILVAAVLMGGYYLILEPRYKEPGQGNRASLDSAKQDYFKRQAYFEDLQKLVENYNKISPSEIERIKRILPTGKDIPGLLVQFQALALQNDFLLSTIDFSDSPSEDENSEIKRLIISVDLLGGTGDSYSEVKDFIAIVETNLRLLDIQSVFFNLESSAYSFTIIAYYN